MTLTLHQKEATEWAEAGYETGMVQLKLPVDHTREQLIHKTAQYLRIPAADILELQIVRQSLECQKKPALFYSYSVNVTVKRKKSI